jgi:zinc protease
MKKTTLIAAMAFMGLYAVAQKSNGEVSAKKVIADYLKAIGGEEELKKVKTIWIVSEQDVVAAMMVKYPREGKADTALPMNVALARLVIETKQMTPNKFLATGASDSAKTPYNYKMVFDGAGGFVMQNGIQSSIPDVQLARLKSGTQPIYQLQYLSDPAIRLEYKGIEKLNGNDCYKIQVYFPNGGGDRAEYYDINSKLLARKVDSSGKSKEIVDYSDYKMVDHVLFSYGQKVFQGEGGPAQDRRVTSIRLNIGVSESDFASGKKK